MRFVKQLEYHKIPEWSSYYIDYRCIKSIIYDYQKSIEWDDSHYAPGEEALAESLQAGLMSQYQKINQFYNIKKAQYKNELETAFYKIYSIRSASTITEKEEKKLLSMDEKDDESNISASLQRAFCDVHKRIWWLEVYCEVNYIACLRLLDKLDHPSTFKAELESQSFRQFEHELGDLRRTMYSKVAQEVMNNNLYASIQLITRGAKYYRISDIARIFLCLGISVMCLSITLWLIAFSEKSMLSSKIFPSFSIFRLTLAINIDILAFAWVIYMLESHSLNWVYIFDIDPTNRISYIQILRVGLSIATLWFITFLLQVANYMSEGIHSNIFALFVLAIYLAIWICPFHILYRRARYALLKSFAEFMIAPFGPVKFTNYMFGSWLTSMVIPIKDMYLSGCFISTDAWELNEYPSCSQHYLILALLPALPFVWRLMQVCNKIYSDPALIKKQYTNLIRYGQSLSLIVISYFGLHTSTQAYIWVSVFVICTVYTMILDYWQDWGLLRTSKNGCLLRETLYFRKSFYYFAMISNLFLRFSWSLTLLPVQMFENRYLNNEVMLLVLCLLETFRRTIWTVLRVERESSENTEKYRKIDYIPKPLHSGEFVNS